MWQVWLIISGLFFVIEMMTVGFLVFWFGIGALFAMIVSLFTDSIIIQTVIFLISSTALLFLTKPFVRKISSTNKIKTNAYSVIGKTGTVVKEINSDNRIGQVKIGSEVWSAISNEQDTIPLDTEIEVIEIDGVKVIVKPIKVVITK